MAMRWADLNVRICGSDPEFSVSVSLEQNMKPQEILDLQRLMQMPLAKMVILAVQL